MTTYYVDPVNGNDANDGLSWGTAWKTLLNGATQARLTTTDGDEIRIAKSPDPVSIGNATWTQVSNTLTTSCSNVVISQCDSGWTAGLVTPTYTTSYYRQGTASVQNVLASTSGKVSYITFASLDLSAYARITFWINFGTAVNYSASNPIEIHLCSDTAGNTTALKFTLPRYYYPANYWVPITLEPDASYSFASSGSNIQSLALKTTSAVTNTIRLDNITVAKAASDSTSLVLTDFVAINETTPFWFQINNIDGTSVDIRGSAGDQATGSASNQVAYVSRNGTVTVDTIKRWGFDTASDVVLTTNTAAGPCALVYTAIANWPATKTYIGGVNTATNLVDGESWFDGRTSYGFGVTQTNSQSSSYSLANVTATRYYDNFTLQQTCYSSVTGCNSVAPGRSGVAVYFLNTEITVKQNSSWSFGCISMGSSGFSRNGIIAGSGMGNTQYINQYPMDISVKYIRGPHSASVISMSSYTNALKFTSTGTIVCGSSGDVITSGTNNTVAGGAYCINVNDVYWTTGSGVIYGISAVAGAVPDYSGAQTPMIVNITGEIGSKSSSASFACTVGSGHRGAMVIDMGTTGTWLMGATGTSAIMASNHQASYITIRNMRSNRPAGLTVSMSPGSILVLEDAFGTTGRTIIRTPQSNVSLSSATQDVWTLQNTVSYSGSAWKTIVTTGNNTRLPLGTVALSAGTSATISIRTNRSDTNARVRLIVTADINNILIAEASSTGTWEQLTVTYTPTYNAVVYPWIVLDSITATSTVYVDDLQVTQA